MSGRPADWAPGTWRVTGSSLDGGWLPIPPRGDVPADWVERSTAEIRRGWGDAWTPEFAAAVPKVLAAALEHRRPEDFLAFQVWPMRHLVCAFVHVALGIRGADDVMPGPGDGVLLESTGLGTGVFVPRVEQYGDASALGCDIVFAFEDGVTVIVSVEPTFQDLFAMLTPSIRSFVHSLELVGPDDAVRKAMPPALLEAGERDLWVDILAAR